MSGLKPEGIFLQGVIVIGIVVIAQELLDIQTQVVLFAKELE